MRFCSLNRVWFDYMALTTCCNSLSMRRQVIHCTKGQQLLHQKLFAKPIHTWVFFVSSKFVLKPSSWSTDAGRPLCTTDKPFQISTIYVVVVAVPLLCVLIIYFTWMNAIEMIIKRRNGRGYMRTQRQMRKNSRKKIVHIFYLKDYERPTATKL